MTMNLSRLIPALALAFAANSAFAKISVVAAADADPYLWLEQIREPAALDWAQSQTAATEAKLHASSTYADMREDFRKILASKDRLPIGRARGGFIYNFWPDAEHPHGVLRRTSLGEYAKAEPAWETLLDLDALGKAEGTPWVFKGNRTLEPGYDRALLTLSPNGGDSAVIREFDIESKSFVPGGFELPAAKSSMNWVSRDAVLVSTDFGAGTLTTAGYTRQIRYWKRGEPLASARLVFEGQATDSTVGASYDRE